MSSPQLFNKENLATTQELEPFKRKASSLAAIDYLGISAATCFCNPMGAR
jgi:hypothetical protein